MERIVYPLGAGFSVPLGLPVMSDFYFKSQDMYLAYPDKYGHFKEGFDTIRDKMSQNINGNEIHYLLNRLTGTVDDFKFK